MGLLDRFRKAQATPQPITQALDQQGMSLSADFGPGTPITPLHGYSTRARGFDYPIGANINLRPRAAYGRPSFETLKALIDAWDLARICINHKIDDLRSMELLFQPAEGVDDDVDLEIKAARAALAFPDRELPFDSWLAKWCEGLWRYDAACLYRRRNRAGEVIGLEVVDGTSILPYIDENGRRPRPPAPAFAQIIKGVGYEWLTSDDLIYTPFRPQPDSPYGLAPIESLLLTANTDLRFQKYFLDYFTAGSLPGGLMQAPEDASSPDQVQEWQDYWDALLLGDQEVLRQIKIVPHGMVLEQVREATFDENFPIYLMRRCCAMYGVTPQDLGITLDVNRANGDTQVDIQFRVNTLPPTRFLQRIISRYIQTDLGLPVQVAFDDGQEKEDRLAEANAWKIWIGAGVASPDEPREKVLGLPVDPSRPVPRGIISERLGFVPLASMLEIAGPVDPETAAPLDSLPLPQETFDGTPALLPYKPPGGAEFKRAPLNPDEPQFPALEKPVPGTGVEVPGAARTVHSSSDRVAKDGVTAGVTAETGLSGYDLDDQDDDEDERRERLVKVELAAFQRFAKTRRAAGKWRDFRFDHVDDTQAALLNELGRTLVAKAGEPDRPKASWRDDAADTPAAKFDLRITDHYAPLIAQAVENLWTKAQLRRAIGAMRPEIVAKSTPAPLPPPNDTRLRELIRLLVLDGLIAGDHTAGLQLGAGALQLVESGINWSAWKPGDPDAAALVADGGLQELLAEADVRISGITDTTTRLIGDAIADGLKAGSSVDTVMGALVGIVADPSRAEMIAHTETARAMTASTLATYQANGIAQWDLITSSGACPTCLSVAADNPHPAVDSSDSPPVHPRCRCAASPVVPGQ